MELGCYWYRKGAEKGYPTAQYYYGLCLYQGKGVAADPVAGIDWIHRAAIGGYAGAMVVVGVAYHGGIGGLALDRYAAYNWFRRAAEAGDPEGQSFAGQCLLHGDGVEADLLEARLWLLKAALRLEPAACYELGKLSDTAVDGDAGWAEALAWYRLAAEHGHAGAQRRIGVHYQHGAGVPKDPAEAVRWLYRAALQADADARLRLGQQLLEGEGVPKDERSGFGWIQAAAHQGHAFAVYELARCYSFGLGCPLDPASERKHLLEAARRGLPEAQYTLGCHLRREGSMRSLHLAAYWLRKAAEQGFPPAQERLREMRRKGELEGGSKADPDGPDERSA